MRAPRRSRRSAVPSGRVPDERPRRVRLDGRVAVVTGASSGLGAGFAVALAEAGADVVLAARRADRLADVAAGVTATGRRSISVTTDVADPDQCTALAEAAVEAFGRFDVLINNAGLGTAVPAIRERPDDFRRVLDVNLMGAYWMAQAAARLMQPGRASSISPARSLSSPRRRRRPPTRRARPASSG